MSTITNLKTNKTLFIPCDCRSEILVIEYDHELKTADLSIYENRISYTNKLSLWQRIKYCYQILIYKKPYTDQILLNLKQLKELSLFLSGLDL